jgi:hypothetical protein
MARFTEKPTMISTYIALAFALGIVLGRWSRKPRTGDWMHTRFSQDFSGYPVMKSWRVDVVEAARRVK